MRALVLVGLCGCGVLLSPAGPASSAPVLVELDRHECLGECPVYRLIVYEDGVVEYHGRAQVDVVATRTSRLDASKVELLRYAFEAEHLARMPDYPHADCTDFPEVELTYRGRHIRHDHGDRRAPEELSSLEDLIDDVTKSVRWVGAEHARAQPLGTFCE